jgi:phage-related protein
MGIKKFFKKVGGWVKDKFHKVKNAVTKFAKPVIGVAKKVVNFVDKTPLGPVLSKVSGGIFDGVKKVINILPDGEVKNNVQNFANKAESTAGQVVNKVENAQNKAQGLINKGRDLFDRGKQAAEIFKQTRIQPKANM